jgi:hypothetical protein
MTKDLEIASMKKQILHQIGLETQAGIPKTSLTLIPPITTQISPTKTRFNPGVNNKILVKRDTDSNRILNARTRT